MSEPTDELLDVWMRGETETVTANETTQPAATETATPSHQVPDGAVVVMPLLEEAVRAERAKAARMWHALSLLVFLIVAASVVPLIIASAKVAGWLAGL